MTDTGRASQSDTPMLDASEGDPDRENLGASGGEHGSADEVQQAPADPQDPPVDPEQPTNPA